MTELSGDVNGTWAVWSDAGLDPLEDGLGKNEATKRLQELQEQGRNDVYAMNDITGEELVLDD